LSDHTLGSMVSPLPIMQMVMGFQVSKTLAVAHDLELFSRLSRIGGATLSQLAAACGIDERPAEMLLTACVSIGLLESNGGHYANTALAEQFLVPGKPYYLGGYVHMVDDRLYLAWNELGEAVRGNHPLTWDPNAQRSLFESDDPIMRELFWDGLHSISTFTGRVLAGAVDFASIEALLDLGGGSGACSIELCRHYPHLRATVLDLPQVTEIAARKIAEAGFGRRINPCAGDFFGGPALPGGHDAILLSMILHDWDEVQNAQILAKCCAALPAGGTLIISERLINDEKTGPIAAALNSLMLLVETEGGRNYTPAEYGLWLHVAGFERIRTVRFEAIGANGALIASKP
jgi:3-hydroxy-5-methyl-1-naphthoate 3-O-methyltransferase